MAASRPTYIVPWYERYGRAVNTAWLAGVILRHAGAVAAAASMVAAIEQAEQQREVLEFETVDLADDDDSVSSGETVASDASCSDHLNSGAVRVFGTKRLRPKQDQAIKKICFDSECEGKMIVVDRTGGGKSLILAMTSIIVAGISVVIVPLLALTANQLARLNRAVSKYGAVTAIHLDETSKDDLLHRVIPKMDSLPSNTSSTLILLCSPQALATDKDLLAAVLRAYQRKILRLVAIDEAHLYAMHGRSFRESIRVLQHVFFGVLFAESATWSPLFLAMTATMPATLLASFSTLTNVDWTIPCRQLWSSAKEF